MKAAGGVVAVALAIALQTTLARFFAAGAVAFDLVLVAVVYVALTTGPASGLLTGSLAGIIQDALSTGVIGVGGLAKSIVGFLAGALGQQFIVTAALPRFVMFAAAGAVHTVLFMGLYVMLGLRTFPSPWTAILGQAAGNAVVGIIAFAVVERLPGAIERRRSTRHRRR